MIPQDPSSENPSLHERALGAYLGLAVGDALGATVEFMGPRDIQATYGVHDRMIGGGWLQLRPGQVTDDTEMSLCIGRALLRSGGWKLSALCNEWAKWLQSRPVDVGNTCGAGITRYIRYRSTSKPPSERDAGNGALMRNLPVVLATLHTPDDFERWSLEQAHVTHNHRLSDAAILALGKMVRTLILGESPCDCRDEADALIQRHPEFCFDPYEGRCSAYVVETVQTVLHFFFRTDSFRSCLVETVNQGGDADTTGAIAGMLAGAAYGMAAIPQNWLTTLDHKVKAEIERQTAGLLGFAASRPAA
jgi:ADP-ribosyl-[dinitrogen reductase] hydrolase